MNVPTSVAAALPQPSEAVYSTDTLALFKTYTRDTYLAEFGVQAPAWDPNRSRKAWFDSAALNAANSAAPRTYSALGQSADSSWGLQPLTISAHDADRKSTRLNSSH